MKTLKSGVVDPEVKRLKTILNKLGSDLNPENQNYFGETETAVRKFQAAHGLKVDGVVGPQTWTKLLEIEGTVTSPDVPNPIVIGDNFGAPWVFANLDLLGRSETDKDLVARYEPEWKLEGLPGYKGLAGNARAWCSVRANADRRKVGVKGTNSAAASSWSRWGYKSPFWFGAALDIAHDKGRGGRHICDFLYWINESKRIAATLDGNRGNKFCVAKTDLSGSGDILVAGPRWSNDVAPGRLVSMQEVLAKYPNLKVGSVAGSTR